MSLSSIKLCTRSWQSLAWVALLQQQRGSVPLYQGSEPQGSFRVRGSDPTTAAESNSLLAESSKVCSVWSPKLLQKQKNYSLSEQKWSFDVSHSRENPISFTYKPLLSFFHFENESTSQDLSETWFLDVKIWDKPGKIGAPMLNGG